MLAGMLVASLSVYVVLQWRQESLLLGDLQNTLESKGLLFRTVISDEISNSRKVASNANIVESLQLLESKRDAAKVFLNIEAVADSFLQTGFSGVSFQDIRGEEVTRAGQFSQNKNQRVAIVGMPQVYLLWDNQFILQVTTDIVGSGGRRIGLAMTETPLHFLTESFVNVAAIGKTAELAVCAPVANDATNADCVLHNMTGNSFKRVPRTIDGQALPIDYSLTGKTGHIETSDYRRERVIAAYAPVDGLGLSTVLKVDRIELYRVISGQLTYVAPLLLAILALGLLLLNFLVRPLVRQLAKSEQAALDEHALFLSSEARFTNIVDLALDAIISVDMDEKILTFNKGAEAMFGYTAAELLGWPLAKLIPVRFANARGRLLEQLVAKTRADDLTARRAEIMGLRRDGLEFFVEASVSQMKEGGKLASIVIVRDVSARKQAEQRISHMAKHDELTNLPNRNFFRDRLQQALLQAQRNGTHGAVLFIDLDQFKGINDSMGHDIGDLLLKDVAKRLTLGLRSQDTVARQGGDEFIVLLHTIAKAQDAGSTTKKLLDALLMPYHLQGEELYISASVGIAIFPDDGKDVNALLKNSDTAMYHAKAAGRNNYQFFSQQMNELAKVKQAMGVQLHHALRRQELVLLYLPMVDMASGKLAGLEALLYWQHPQQGLIAPPMFMPLAEEIGLSGTIGEWALRSACVQLKDWLDQGYYVPQLALHFSSKQFQQKNMVQVIANALHETGIEAHLLELALTKNIFMENSDAMVESLLTLDDMGLNVSIDDFGSGYASLNHLKRFSIAKLKIDRHFIHNIATDPNDALIVAGVIGLAHSLRMKVSVAGVETEAQRAILALHGCDEYQGTLFSGPLPASEIVAKLQRPQA